MEIQGTYDIMDLQVSKSKDLITAAFAMPARCQKILTAAIAKLNPFEPAPPTGATVFLTVNEIKQVLGITGNTIYSQIDDLCKKIGGNNSFYFSNEKDGITGFFSLVDSCVYEDGKGMVINFGKAATPFLFEIQKNANGFSTYAIANIVGLHSSYAIRFYELFKGLIFKINKNNPYVEVVYGLNQLKIVLGVYDMDTSEASKAKKLMANGETNYDVVASAIKGNLPYDRFSNFKARVLDKAQEEMEKYSDVRFDYEPVRRSRKVVAIKFKVYKNYPTEAIIIANKKRLEDVLKSNPTNIEKQDAILEYIMDTVKEERIKLSEARLIAEYSGYDISIFDRAYLMARQSNTNIEHMGRWLISCIKNNWPERGTSTFENKVNDEDVIDMEEYLRTQGT